jgi:hypothetical protein
MADRQDLVAKSRLIDEMSVKNRLIEFFTKWEVILVIIFTLMVLFSQPDPLLPGLVQFNECNLPVQREGDHGPADDFHHHVRRY